MKIYILPVDDKYYKRPKINPFCIHSDGFNVETGFHNYLIHGENTPIVVDDPKYADWHYLPIYWSYWQLSNDYGRKNREEMEQYLKKVILNPEKTFTVSEADNEPNFGIKIKVFSGNTADHGWTPIPIITLPHLFPEVTPTKKYLSNFVGTISKWYERIRMKSLVEDRDDVKLIQSKKDEKLFVNTILESYSTLCPRGSALGSYRFYESMQLGVVPIMISDYDFRPFPDKINWSECSYFLKDVEELPDLLDSLDRVELLDKGKKAQLIWNMLFNFWPQYLLESL